jgi:chaperonin GroES
MNNVRLMPPLRRGAKYPEKTQKLTGRSGGLFAPKSPFFRLPGLTGSGLLPKYQARPWHSSGPSAATRKLSHSYKNLGKRIPMKFRPLGDRVVVRRIKEDQKTAGGIIIPDTVAEKPQEGEVISVGPGAPDNNGKLVPTTVKAGDYVLFGKWSGTEVKLDGEELLIMKESDILGVLEGRKAKK